MAIIYLLSKHLGHRSVKITERYLDAMERLHVDQRKGLRLPWSPKPDSNEGGPNGEQPSLAGMDHLRLDELVPEGMPEPSHPAPPPSQPRHRRA